MVDVRRNWEKVYKAKTTPWDVGEPEDELVKFLNSEMLKPGSRVLELGCGYGNDAIFLAKSGFDVTAVDISKMAIRAAKKRAKKAGVRVKFLVADATDPKQVYGKFDFVYDRACFHFIPKEKRHGYLSALRRLLNKGCYFLLFVSSDKDTVTGPYKFSKDDIRRIFGRDFEILDLRLVTLEKHALKPKPYLCLMRRK